jgi:hypothetical protein
MKYITLVIALCGCNAVHSLITPGYNQSLICEQSYGYYGPDTFFETYPEFRATGLTPHGILYQGNVDPARLDARSTAVLACVHAEARMGQFRVLVTPGVPGCLDQPVLPVRAYSADGSCGKSLTAACPCRWRAGVVCPNTIVTLESLALYNDALIRWALGPQALADVNYNPWARSDLMPCLSLP